MKKLKLNLQQIEGAEVLTRSQLKQIMGGDGGSGNCNAGQYWLNCTTPNGTESWCRNEQSGSANTACENIYPAYNPQDVSGNWAIVIIV